MAATEILLSLFLVMLIGFGAGRLHLFDEDARRAFSKFVFYVATSAVIFVSVASIDVADLQHLPRFLFANSVLYILLFVVLYVALRLIKTPYKVGGSVLYAGITANSIFLGLPLVAALYGSEGVLFAVAFIAIPLSVADLAGFYALSSWQHGRGAPKAVLRDFITNPLVLATLGGALLLVTGIGLWEPIKRGLNLVGAGATGIALFTMGLFLATTSWRHFKVRVAAVTSFVKLLFVPLVALGVGVLCGLSGVALAVTVIMAAMPSAVFCMVVATEYDLDERATSDSILLSSVLFLFTSLFWISIVQ